MTQLTHARLRQLLHYDPETGVFTWLVRRGKANVGSIAGCRFRKNKEYSEYLAIRIDGQLYQNAARLAWLYMTGAFPDRHVDHKNRKPLDNRWCNLRLATPSQNGANKEIRIDNKSGRTGVIFLPDRGKWRADISVGGKNKHIGYFLDKDAAYAAYREAKVRFYGEFA